MIRVVLPFHLRNLAQVTGEVSLEVTGPVTMRSILDALEMKFPVLRGTIRDHGAIKRRPLIRFFVCEQDWSDEPVEKELPSAISSGKEPFFVIGAIAGG